MLFNFHDVIFTVIFPSVTPLFLANAFQMDYGAFNQLIGREVDQAFWGTRTEHIVGVAACLAVTDHASQKVFSSYLGRELCFAKVRCNPRSNFSLGTHSPRVSLSPVL